MGKCGFNCRECSYFKKPCIGCVIETCLVDKCIKGTSYTGITHPRSFCKLRQYCPIGGNSRPLPVLIQPIGNRQMIKVKFSKFIPEIDITDQGPGFGRMVSKYQRFSCLSGNCLQTKACCPKLLVRVSMITLASTAKYYSPQLCLTSLSIGLRPRTTSS